MKKCLLLLTIIITPFVSYAAPANFPCLTQVLENVSKGTITPKIAQEQPAIESYNDLYSAAMTGVDPNVATILSDVQEKAKTPQEADAVFKTYQNSLVENATTIFE